MWYMMCIFFPSFFSLAIEEKMLENKEIKDFIVCFAKYSLINNIIVTSIFCLLLGTDYNIGQCIELYPGYAVKYAVVSVLISCVIAVIKVVFIKNFEVTVETKAKKNN